MYSINCKHCPMLAPHLQVLFYCHPSQLMFSVSLGIKHRKLKPRQGRTHVLNFPCNRHKGSSSTHTAVYFLAHLSLYFLKLLNFLFYFPVFKEKFFLCIPGCSWTPDPQSLPQRPKSQDYRCVPRHCTYFFMFVTCI